MSAMFGRALPPLPGEMAPEVLEQAPVNVLVDFLLPTGVIVPMQCQQRSTLRQVKEELFREAKNYPLFSLLKEKGFYNFVGISKDGDREELVNEAQTLEDAGLFIPLLRLVERKGDQGEKLLNAEISNLIGKKLHDFDVMGGEVQDFRRTMLVLCEEAVRARNESDETVVHYSFPPNLIAREASALLCPEDNRVASNVSRNMMVNVCYMSSDGKLHQTTLQVDIESYPHSLLELAMRSRELQHIIGRFRSNELVLKVIGREEYFLEKRVALIRYKYIANCLAKQMRPELSLKPFHELVPKDRDTFIRPVHGFQQTGPSPYGQSGGALGTLRRAPSVRSQAVSIWDVKETYQVKILSAKNVNVAENHKVYVRAGIYHGSEPQCQVVVTSRGAAPENAEWNEILEFAIPVVDVPRAAKLCFVILGATESAMASWKKGRAKRKQTKDLTPVAWVNMNVFDYTGRLQQGKQTLYSWPIEAELGDSVNYMGPTVLNSSSSSECVCLEVEITELPLPPSSRSRAVVFPPLEDIRKFAHEVSQVATPADKFPPEEVESLQKVVEQDPLAQLDEQDKELIWKMRNVCVQSFPFSLPKLLQSVCWNNRSDVAQLYGLLEKWKRLPPEVAMGLLDYQFADIAVRSWAVKCLEVLSDEKLLMYLLQLVQVLKFEPYLDCALGQFLLRKAFSNKTIGHFLFWHLRAEMHLPTVSVRYGLMLEAYCRGCGTYLTELTNQLASLSKMKQVTDLMQTISKKKTDDLLRCMQEPHFVSALQNISSPLDPSLHCKALKVDRCKVMDSKMRPLWLVFQNQDTLGADILQIFKNGDDLRQDMLTLQIMSIMDIQWKQAGLDLRMNPYGCLSTGDQVGMIEIVLKASTIAKIQKKKGARGAFDKKLLYHWLKDKNPDPASMEKAIENFTYSCAGSCVATYVLGIGDRHSDNIMLKENGQLVHIDFGHFLGNFKSKFGVKRERVPFVLTDDFIYIITKEGDKSSPEFTKFKRLCAEAFLKLRDRGELFINLFTMMLSCGIPELRTSDDISYIRDALCLGESKEVALDIFRKKLQEAIKNSWSVSLNWYFHNVARTGN